MQGLSCHLVVEVHLYAVLSNLDNDSREDSAHAVHHRDRVARDEEVFADFSVHLEGCLWKVDDP